MRRRPPPASRVLLATAVVVATGGALVMRAHLRRLELKAATLPGVPVTVAARPLARGTVLSAEMLGTASVPPPYLPPGSIRSRDDALGLTLAADVAAGEVLTRARLAPPAGPVAALVPPGLRAVPISAQVPRRAVEPGDAVDVLAVFATGPPHAETVVSGAEVVGIMEGQGALDAGPASTIIVLVSPDTAERLAYARAFGELSIAVHPPLGPLQRP